jgi:hypothetical protein
MLVIESMLEWLSTWALDCTCINCVIRALLLDPRIKLHGLNPQANYTDRATAVCRRS